jgi:hypothetical protein
MNDAERIVRVVCEGAAWSIGAGFTAGGFLLVLVVAWVALTRGLLWVADTLSAFTSRNPALAWVVIERQLTRLESAGIVEQNSPDNWVVTRAAWPEVQARCEAWTEANP